MKKKKGRSEHPLEAKYRQFLDKGERLESKFDVGMYVVLFTNKRVLFKKKVSHSLITFPYADVEVAEYVTVVHWVYLIIASVLFSFTYAFLLMTPEVERTTFTLTGTQVIMTQGGPAATPVFYWLFGFACLAFGFWFLFHFILSLFGMLRVELLGDRRAIEVRAKWNDDISKILNLLDRKK